MDHVDDNTAVDQQSFNIVRDFHENQTPSNTAQPKQIDLAAMQHAMMNQHLILLHSITTSCVTSDFLDRSHLVNPSPLRQRHVNVNSEAIDFNNLDSYIQGSSSDAWALHYNLFMNQYRKYQQERKKKKAKSIVLPSSSNIKQTPNKELYQNRLRTSILSRSLKSLGKRFHLQKLNQRQEEFESQQGYHTSPIELKPFKDTEENVDYEVLDDKTLQIMTNVLLSQYQSTHMTAKQRREGMRLMQKLIWDRREQAEMSERDKAAIVIQKHWRRYQICSIVMPRVKTCINRFKLRELFKAWLRNAKARRYSKFRVQRSAFTNWVKFVYYMFVCRQRHAIMIRSVYIKRIQLFCLQFWYRYTRYVTAYRNNEPPPKFSSLEVYDLFVQKFENRVRCMKKIQAVEKGYWMGKIFTELRQYALHNKFLKTRHQLFSERKNVSLLSKGFIALKRDYFEKRKMKRENNLIKMIFLEELKKRFLLQKKVVRAQQQISLVTKRGIFWSWKKKAVFESDVTAQVFQNGSVTVDKIGNVSSIESSSDSTSKITDQADDREEQLSARGNEGNYDVDFMYEEDEGKNEVTGDKSKWLPQRKNQAAVSRIRRADSTHSVQDHDLINTSSNPGTLPSENTVPPAYEYFDDTDSETSSVKSSPIEASDFYQTDEKENDLPAFDTIQYLQSSSMNNFVSISDDNISQPNGGAEVSHVTVYGSFQRVKRVNSEPQILLYKSLQPRISENSSTEMRKKHIEGYRPLSEGYHSSNTHPTTESVIHESPRYSASSSQLETQQRKGARIRNQRLESFKKRAIVASSTVYGSSSHEWMTGNAFPDQKDKKRTKKSLFLSQLKKNHRRKSITAELRAENSGSFALCLETLIPLDHIPPLVPRKQPSNNSVRQNGSFSVSNSGAKKLPPIDSHFVAKWKAKTRGQD